MIFDLHNDLPTSDMTDRQKTGYIGKAGDNTVTLAVWTTRLSDPLAEIEKTVRMFAGNGSVRFAVEDAGFATDENTDTLASLPLSYCTLAWSGNNAVAGGHKGDGGLTELGKKLISRLAANGIAADTAHLNEKSFYDVLGTGAKVLCSHTCLRSLHDHTRNLSDAQVRALIDAGGIVGIAAVADFMGGQCAGIDDYAVELCRYAEKFGVGTLCIGTDFFGAEPLKGLENYTCFDSLAEMLSKKGFSGIDINDIFYNNANKFFSNTGER